MTNQYDAIALLPMLPALREKVKVLEQEIIREYGIRVIVDIRAIDAEHYIDAIARLVSDTLGVTMNKIIGTSRLADQVEARHIAMYLAYTKVPSLTMEAIAAYFGKDHTTVVSAKKKIEDLIDVNDEQIIAKLAACESEIKKRLKSHEN